MQTNSHSKKTNKQPPIRTRKRSDPFQHMSSGNSSPGDSTTPCKGGATSSTDKQKEKARVSRTSLILWHAHQNDAAAVRKLLEEDQSLVHARDYDNRTPLHVASLHGWIDVAKCLIEYGADVNAQDRWKNTVLFFLSEDDYSELWFNYPSLDSDHCCWFFTGVLEFLYNAFDFFY